MRERSKEEKKKENRRKEKRRKKKRRKSIAPRSHGCGDVTATYIRKSKIPSRIYAKYQYMQESEYESTVYIPAIITQVHSYHRT